MRRFRLFCFIFFVTTTLTSCHKGVVNPNSNLTLDDYAEYDTALYRLSSRRIRRQIDSLMRHDHDSLSVDYRVRGYYAGRGEFIWIDRKGLDDRADTLLAHLQNVRCMGLNEQKFRLPQIEDDLRHARNLDFDDDHYAINRVMARLEYNLTKAYLRYVSGQRFGFFNAHYVLNRLDHVEAKDSTTGYRQLFDLPMEHATRAFYRQALHQVAVDSVSQFLSASEPDNPLYYRLLQLLPTAKGSRRRLVLINMDRCRARMPHYPEKDRKYVLVNIPSFHLIAVDGTQTLMMRIGCGTLETKTPLLVSAIKRMDINPQWILPRSIIKKSVTRHAGSRGYFNSHRYFIRERATGKTLDPARVSREMLESGDYLVMQEGGAHSALGRIIFRFDNGFSIYLHDTSSRGFFSQEDRGVSHGCVRVERPFDLAVFLLKDKDERLIDRIRYSMTADVSPVGKRRDELTEEQQAVADTLDKRRLIGNVTVRPAVPIYIWYFTLYPASDGTMQAYDDVYGYDALVWQALKNYL